MAVEVISLFLERDNDICVFGVRRCGSALIYVGILLGLILQLLLGEAFVFGGQLRNEAVLYLVGCLVHEP